MLVMVVTRAQAQKKLAQLFIDEEGYARLSPNSWKSSRQKRVSINKKTEEKDLENTIEQKKKSLHEGGLVLAINVFEPSKTMQDSYEARESNQTKPKPTKKSLLYHSTSIFKTKNKKIQKKKRPHPRKREYISN